MGGFKGSATKGQLRKRGLTAVVQSVTQQKQGRGVQQGSGIPFQIDPLYHGPLTSCRDTRPPGLVLEDDQGVVLHLHPILILVLLLLLSVLVIDSMIMFIITNIISINPYH